MKRVLVFLIFAFCLMIIGSVSAQNSCEEATIAALRTCVQHAVDEGHIDNPGIANSLFAKLDAAQRALDRGNTRGAIHQLEAFIHHVEAQSGKHIEAEHAQHMIHHAHLVIEALGS